MQRLFLVLASTVAASLFPLPALAKIINIPCADGGGSAGWSHTQQLPDRYYPMVLVAVAPLKPGLYPTHPMYHAPYDGRTRYGYCAYSTSSD